MSEEEPADGIGWFIKVDIRPEAASVTLLAQDPRTGQPLLAGELQSPGPSPGEAIDDLIMRLDAGRVAAHRQHGRGRRRHAPPPPRQGQLWSAEENRHLLAGRGSGLTVDELAHAHERSVGAIRSRLAMLDLAPRGQHEDPELERTERPG